MELIDELVVIFLESDYKVTYKLNTTTKKILVDTSKPLTEELGSNGEDEETVRIPQITKSEAYDLMVKFAEMQDSTIAVQLLDVLTGRKPFNSFQDKLGEHGIGDKWYDYENNYAKKKMFAWLDEIQLS